jgi:hypothetical protein
MSLAQLGKSVPVSMTGLLFYRGSWRFSHQYWCVKMLPAHISCLIINA